MNTLALYYRASNEDNNSCESATISNQRDLLHHYISTQPEFAKWNIVEFQDDGWSGTNFNRPGIKSLLSMAGKEISCIIVKDFSRFGRNLIEVGNFLDQVFPSLGVRFIAVNENYDSNNHIGYTVGLDVSFRALLYELYSRDLSKKISSAKETKMKNGGYVGSFSFYGYKRSNCSKSGLIIDPESAEIVRRIFLLAANGIKPKEIAFQLNNDNILPPLSYRKKQYPNENYQCPTATSHNIWTHGNVAKILNDERYTGVMLSKKRTRLNISTNKYESIDKENWIRVNNAMEAIVTSEQFNKAQVIFHRRNTKK